jgi:adenylate kinase family enzyme
MVMHVDREGSQLRAVIIGTSCSGKTTFAGKLSQLMGINHIELDQLYWEPNWKERPNEEFRDLVRDAVRPESWVVDGNYSVVRDIVWPRANIIIWLNYSFPIVLYRSIKRSFVRAATKERLFAGNVETFSQSFFSSNSIIWWVMKTYHKNKITYPGLVKKSQENGVIVLDLTTPKDADRCIEDMVDMKENIYLSTQHKGVN